MWVSTQRIWKRDSNQDLHSQVHSIIIHSSQKAEAIQVPINGSMNKNNVVNTEMEYYSALRWR